MKRLNESEEKKNRLRSVKTGAKKLYRRIAAGTVIAAAGAGIALNGLFKGPGELMKNGPAGTEADAVRAVETETRVPSDVGTLRIPQEPTAAERIRMKIWELPDAAKAAILLPLYGVGFGLLKLGSAVLTWNPVTEALVGFLACALGLFGAFAVGYKALFPKEKLGNLVKNGRWLWFVGGGAVLYLLNIFLENEWEQWKWVRLAAGAAAAFLAILFLWRRLFRGHAAPEPESKWIELPKTA